MASTYIPPEILLQITSFITDTSTLTAAAHVNHFLYTNLQPRLNRLKIWYITSLYLSARDLGSLSRTCKCVYSVVSPVLSADRDLYENLRELVERMTCVQELPLSRELPFSRQFREELREDEWYARIRTAAQLHAWWVRAVGGYAEAGTRGGGASWEELIAI